jgi:hypothetical protein
MYSARALGIRLGTLAHRFSGQDDRTRELNAPEPSRCSTGGKSSAGASVRQSCRRKSDIRFREPSAWDKYRWYIVGAIALAALQTMMIAALVVERSRRRRGQERYAMATAAGGVGVFDRFVRWLYRSLTVYKKY